MKVWGYKGIVGNSFEVWTVKGLRIPLLKMMADTRVLTIPMSETTCKTRYDLPLGINLGRKIPNSGWKFLERILMEI